MLKCVNLDAMLHNMSGQWPRNDSNFGRNLSSEVSNVSVGNYRVLENMAVPRWLNKAAGERTLDFRNYNEFLGLKAPQIGRVGRRILGKLSLRGPFFSPETVVEYDKTASTRFMTSRGLQPAPRLQARGNDSKNSALNKA